MNTTKKEVKVGLIGVGLNTYWNQFEGLLSRLTDYQRMIKERMSGLQATVIDGGMVDSPEKAARTAEVLKSEDIEILFIFISTYALSSTILPIAQRIKIPVILLNIQPVAAINYDYINGLGDRGKMTGEWLAHCQACSTPEFACVFNRAGIKYDILTGYLEEPYVWNEIENWIDAVRAVQGMRNNRMGILGHYYCGMLDVYTDPSDRPAHQDSGYPAQHTTRSRHKLRLYQRIRRPWKNDRRMAGSLPSLFHSGICLRIQPCRHQIRHPDRLPRRTIRMERNRKLDRCGKGRTRDA